MIRNIGALLVKGVKPREIFTQHMAKYTSPTNGKDGTSHFGDLKDLHIVSPISMLGDLIPVMTGVAMAGRYLGQDIVTMTWIGDGGSSTGVFHEGLNLAAVQRASLVLIIENNQWAYSTPVSKQSPFAIWPNAARAYGITSVTIDGNDVLAVYRTAKAAVEQCRAGNGPVLIEAKTIACAATRSTIRRNMCRRRCANTGRRATIARYEKSSPKIKSGTPRPKKKSKRASKNR